MPVLDQEEAAKLFGFTEDDDNANKNKQSNIGNIKMPIDENGNPIASKPHGVDFLIEAEKEFGKGFAVGLSSTEAALIDMETYRRENNYNGPLECVNGEIVIPTLNKDVDFLEDERNNKSDNPNSINTKSENEYKVHIDSTKILDTGTLSDTSTIEPVDIQDEFIFPEPEKLVIPISSVLTTESDNIKSSDHTKHIEKNIPLSNKKVVKEEDDQESFLDPIMTEDSVEDVESIMESYNLTKEDLMPRNWIPLSDETNSEERMVEINNDELKKKKSEIPNTYEYALKNSLISFNYQQSFLKETLEQFGDTVKAFTDSIQLANGKILKDSCSNKVGQINTPDKLIDGKNAIMYTMAKTVGIRKTRFYNSGFSVTTRANTLTELNDFRTAASVAVFEYGKEFGAYFFMFMDLEIKTKLMDLLYNSIISSDFRDWKNKEEFFKAIVIQDYEVFLWAQSALMYRNGLDSGYVCAEPNCDYYEQIKMDLNKLRINNITALPEWCIDFISDPKPKSLEDIKEYQRRLNLHREFRIENHGFELDVPSWAKFLEEGGKFNSTMMKEVHFTDRPKVSRYIRYNYYKIYSPWIVKYNSYNSNNELEFATTDTEAIPNILDAMQIDCDRKIRGDSTFDEVFHEQIMNYIKSTKLTIIGYPLLECPKCHTPPNTGYEGIIPYDVQSNFFIWTDQKLERH